MIKMISHRIERWMLGLFAFCIACNSPRESDCHINDDDARELYSMNCRACHKMYKATSVDTLSTLNELSALSTKEVQRSIDDNHKGKFDIKGFTFSLNQCEADGIIRFIKKDSLRTN
jgi:hypothetical protein